MPEVTGKSAAGGGTRLNEYRFVSMTAEECRRHAFECERRAVLATDDDIRQTFFDLAHQWREIAEQIKELVDRRAALEAATNSGRLSSGE